MYRDTFQKYRGQGSLGLSWEVPLLLLCFAPTASLPTRIYCVCLISTSLELCCQSLQRLRSGSQAQLPWISEISRRGHWKRGVCIRSGPVKPNQRKVSSWTFRRGIPEQKFNVNRACFPREETPEFTEKWAKFIWTFRFGPFFGLVCRGDSWLHQIVRNWLSNSWQICNNFAHRSSDVQNETPAILPKFGAQFATNLRKNLKIKFSGGIFLGHERPTRRDIPDPGAGMSRKKLYARRLFLLF